MLLLEESVTLPATLLAHTLYYSGLVGVTQVWTRLTGISPPRVRKPWGELVGLHDDSDESDNEAENEEA
eukprot:3550508-Rhodomonas_salina.1